MATLFARFSLLFSLLAAVVPTMLYVLLLWRIDRYEREPFRLLAVAFFWGAVPAVMASVAIELGFGVSLAALFWDSADVVMASVIAPPVEEGLKGLALLLLFLLAHPEFDGTLDGIVYGALIGFGFAMTENFFYFSRVRGDVAIWRTVVLGRALAFGFNHAMFTAFTGVGFGLARYLQSRLGQGIVAAMGFLIAITVHFVHNLFLSAGDLCLVSFFFDWSGVAVIFVAIVLAWHREKKWIETHLGDEVMEGVLTPSQYEDILSWRRRMRELWRAGCGGDWRRARLRRRFAQAAAELAFKKHRQHAGEGGEALETAITSARAKVVHLRRVLEDEGIRGCTPCFHCDARRRE